MRAYLENPLLSLDLLLPMLEQNRDGFIMTDPEGQIIFWNEVQEKNSGIVAKDTIGKPALDVYKVIMNGNRAPQDRDNSTWIQANIAATFAGSNNVAWPEKGVIVHTKIDSQIKSVEYIFSPIQTSHGRILATISRDISAQEGDKNTLRKKAIHHKQETDVTRLKAIGVQLAKAAQEGLIITNPAGGIIFINNKMEGWIGHSSASVYLKNLANMVALPSGTKLNEMPHQFEGKIQRKGACAIWGLFCVAHLLDTFGIICGECILVSDITERKKAESEFRESEDQFHSAFNDAPIGMAITALDGRYIRVNHAMCAIMGYSPDELLNLSFQDITHTDDLATNLELDRHLLDGELSSFQMEKRYYHKLGHEIWALLHVSLVRNPQGARRTYISQIQDISERRVIEVQLNEHITQLETFVELTDNIRKAKDAHGIALALLEGFASYLREDSRVILTLCDDSTLGVEGVYKISDAWVGYNHLRCPDPIWHALVSKDPLHLPVADLEGNPNRFYDQLTQDNTRILIQPLHTADGSPIGLLLGTTTCRTSGKNLNPLVNINEMGSSALRQTKRMEQVQQESGERIKEICMLQEAIRITSDTIEPEKAIGEILTVIVHGYKVNKGAVYVKEGGIARLICSSGLDPDLVEKNRLLSLKSDLWQFVQADPPSVTVDIPASLRWAVSKGEHLKLISIPISVEKEKVGLLCLMVDTKGKYDHNDLLRILLISKHFGAVLTREKLNLQIGKEAVVEERCRLARDLHDSITQQLYSLVMFTGSIAKFAQSKDWDEIEPLCVKILAISTSALREMRLMIYQLRLENLETSGLMDALRKRLEAVESRAGIAYSLTGSVSPDLPPDIENELFNIIQEALNNISKHSQASQISLRVDIDDRQASVEIADNGVGFILSETSRGVGLASMTERVEKLGGRLDITSAPDEGTRVSATFPKDFLKHQVLRRN
jgi:PAS domain S-box-containing protein